MDRWKKKRGRLRARVVESKRVRVREEKRGKGEEKERRGLKSRFKKGGVVQVGLVAQCLTDSLESVSFLCPEYSFVRGSWSRSTPYTVRCSVVVLNIRLLYPVHALCSVVNFDFSRREGVPWTVRLMVFY